MKSDWYSLIPFPLRKSSWKRLHVLGVCCAMRNYTSFLKNHRASPAFPDYIKPAWGAIQGQDSASPQHSHPGNWSLWRPACVFLARMTQVLLSCALTLYTEQGAARFPGNRNKDPPSSQRNGFKKKKNHHALLEPNPLPTKWTQYWCYCGELSGSAYTPLIMCWVTFLSVNICEVLGL